MKRGENTISGRSRGQVLGPVNSSSQMHTSQCPSEQYRPFINTCNRISTHGCEVQCYKCVHNRITSLSVSSVLCSLANSVDPDTHTTWWQNWELQTKLYGNTDYSARIQLLSGQFEVNHTSNSILTNCMLKFIKYGKENPTVCSLGSRAEIFHPKTCPKRHINSTKHYLQNSPGSRPSNS